MGKQEQLIEYIIQDIVDMFSSDQDIEYDEAMNKFYNSKVFEKLQDKETGLYMESSEYVYDLFKDEINFGRIVQAEIRFMTYFLIRIRQRDWMIRRQSISKWNLCVENCRWRYEYRSI